jgi:hypothetical protein
MELKACPQGLFPVGLAGMSCEGDRWNLVSLFGNGQD